MMGVSGVALVAAATAAGIAESFPAHNAGSPEGLDHWLTELQDRAGTASLGPVIPNLIVHRSNDRLAAELAVTLGHPVPAVITRFGSQHSVVGPFTTQAFWLSPTWRRCDCGWSMRSVRPGPVPTLGRALTSL